MGRVVAVVIVLLCIGGILAICQPRSALEAEAASAAQARFGVEPTALQEVQGEREPAVCGEAAGERFVYRRGRLHTAAELGPAFPAFLKAWCDPA